MWRQVALHASRVEPLRRCAIFTFPATHVTRCSMNVLLWFKRDLRIQDHPALTLAASLGPVLPLYVVEPDYWQLPDTSARQWEFTAESLASLRDDLARLGAPLIIRVGDAVETIAHPDHQP
jgi:deoxyribodipyrimidine photolyase